MIKRSAVALLVLCATADATRADAFLCAAQSATGLAWAKERWQAKSLDTADRIYVIQQAGTADYYTVTRIGDAAPVHYCPPLRPSDRTLLLICGGLGSGFTFSSRTLRFQENYGIGYVGGGDGDANFPYLLIGKCIRLDLRGVLRD
jgi:hypothetical protein